MKKRILLFALMLGIGINQTVAQSKTSSIRNTINELETVFLEQEDLLSSAYVYVGDIKPFMNKNDLPFKKIDINALNEIAIPLSSSFRIINKELFPQSSYTLKKSDQGRTLIINNPSLFWEHCRRLIIQTNFLESVDSTIPKRKSVVKNLLKTKEEDTKSTVSIEKAKRELKKLRNKTKSDEKYYDLLVDRIDENDSKINRCYVLITSKKEFRDIVRGTGLSLHKLKWNIENIDKSFFKECDLRMLTEISLKTKNPEILTPVPTSSYRIETCGHERKLIIMSPTEFWKYSNCLIIQL